MTSRVLHLALAFGFALSLGAASAQAGALITSVHKIDIKGKVLASDDGKIVKDKFKNKDIQEICCGEASKDNDLFIQFTNCNPSGNVIQVRDKKTGEVIKTVGSITGLSLIDQEKNGELKKQIGNGQLNVGCDGIDVFAFGKVEVQYDKEGCIDKVKMDDATGDGGVDGIEVILEKTQAKSGKDESDKFSEEP